MTRLFNDNARRKGFTLVEILIVVTILGILVAIVLPAIATATSAARENTMSEDVRFMRSQITLYQAEHVNRPPGYPGGNMGVAPTAAAFADQMLTYSNVTGATSPVRDPAFPFGPYLKKIPQNPINGKDDILIVPDGAALPGAADDSTGWVYQASSRTFRSNAAGNDTAGKPYYDY